MFCIKIFFFEPEPAGPEPSFYRWSRSRKKQFGAGAEEKWLGSATLPLPLSRLSQLTLSSSLKMWTVSVLDEQARKLPQGEKDRLQHNHVDTIQLPAELA